MTGGLDYAAIWRETQRRVAAMERERVKAARARAVAAGRNPSKVSYGSTDKTWNEVWMQVKEEFAGRGRKEDGK